MGLDIYLYRYENKEHTQLLERQYESYSESLWEKKGEYSTLTDEEKKSIREETKQYAVSIGLNESGEDDKKKCIEIVSEKYPEHYFKIGYFRSSYNGSGINRVLSNLDLPDLYDLFNRQDSDDSLWQPDWELALIKTKDCLEQLRQRDNIRCFTLDDFTQDHPTKSESDAIALFLSEKKRQSDFGGYSNREGYFYPKEPLKVYALIHGSRKALFGEHYNPATYVIMEGENEWYCQALEIIIDTIEYVLKQPDKDKYFLYWSS